MLGHHHPLIQAIRPNIAEFEHLRIAVEHSALETSITKMFLELL